MALVLLNVNNKYKYLIFIFFLIIMLIPCSVNAQYASSSESKHFRDSDGSAERWYKSYINYTITNNPTNYVVTINSWGINFNKGWHGDFEGKLSASNGAFDTIEKKYEGKTMNKGDNSFGSKKVTYTKGTSSFTRTITAKVRKTSGNDGTDIKTWQTVTITITVPALAKYIVSYNANGGSGAPAAQTKYYGKNITLSKTVPTQRGYTFNKWNTNSAGTGTPYSPGQTFSSNANTTLYAIWNLTKYTIKYNNESTKGTLRPNPTTYYVTSNFTLKNPQNKPGYTFRGWTGTGLDPNPDKPENSSVHVANQAVNRVYTANYKTNQYNVEYNINAPTGSKIKNDTPPSPNPTFTYGVAQKLAANKYEIKNYKFIGWNRNDLGTGTTYNDQQLVKNLTTADGVTVKLFAMWTKDVIVTIHNLDSNNKPTEEVTKDSSNNYVVYNEREEYTVKYKSNSNGRVTGREEETLLAGEHPSGTDVESHNDNFQLYGWAIRTTSGSPFKVEQDDGTETEYPSNTIINDSDVSNVIVSEPMTLIAQYKSIPELKNYMVIYKSDSNGAVFNQTEIINRGGSPTGRTTVPNTNFKLAGWVCTTHDVNLTDGRIFRKNDTMNLMTSEDVQKIIVKNNIILKAVHINK